jgi:hypothetical protein
MRSKANLGQGAVTAHGYSQPRGQDADGFDGREGLEKHVFLRNEPDFVLRDLRCI